MTKTFVIIALLFLTGCSGDASIKFGALPPCHKPLLTNEQLNTNCVESK